MKPQHALGNFVEAAFVVQATVSLYCTVDISIQYNIVSVLSVLLLCLMLYSQYCNKDNREGRGRGEGKNSWWGKSDHFLRRGTC